jgi:hypothetical protein
VTVRTTLGTSLLFPSLLIRLIGQVGSLAFLSLEDLGFLAILRDLPVTVLTGSSLFQLVTPPVLFVLLPTTLDGLRLSVSLRLSSRPPVTFPGIRARWVCPHPVASGVSTRGS